MDPWWNPAVERQAQDRIHRIGQYKPIRFKNLLASSLFMSADPIILEGWDSKFSVCFRIVRFVIENTIEERILKLQEKKELVFEG